MRSSRFVFSLVMAILLLTACTQRHPSLGLGQPLVVTTRSGVVIRYDN